MSLSRGTGRTLRLLVSVGLLALVLWLAHWPSVVAVLRQVSGSWVLVALALGIADRLLLTYRWQILLAARDVPVGFLRLFGVQLAALHPAVRRRVRLALLPRIPERWGRGVSATVDASLAFRTDRGALIAVAVLTAVLFAVRIYFTKTLALACGADIPLTSLMLPVTIGNIGLQDAGYVGLMSLIGVGAPIAVGVRPTGTLTTSIGGTNAA